MTGYADIFVVPVPSNRREDYRQLAALSERVWLEHGAMSYVEMEADDAKPGKWTSFPQSVDLKESEFVVVAVIHYRSRAHRDDVNAKAMKDPRMAGMDPKTMPFDGKRFFWGGFKPFIGGTTTAAHLQPYLFFRGRCEEAIDYYKRTLGAQVGMMLRFKDNPDKPPHDAVPAELDDRIMHASVRISGAEIMMSDGMRSGPLDFQCMSLSLAFTDEAEAQRLYDGLAAEGRVEMPMGPTFFARKFGSVVDPFGVSWMIMVPADS